MNLLSRVPLILLGLLSGCTDRLAETSQILLITSDFNSVRRCSTVEELDTVAQIMISARPDIMALDATANGLVNYGSDIGFLIPGSPFDALLEAGVEPFGIMVDTLRSHGITVLANVRMNDHHGKEIQWTPWERDHREWSLAEDTGARDWKAIGALRQMDYAIEGVRVYRFSILQEILQKFPVDGLQLDFGRTAPFLSEPKAENARFLTGYLRQVRQLLEETALKRQREKMVLGVIVPWDMDFCLQEGLEVGEWIREELIDYVSPGEWYYADWNIPLDGWRQMTRGTSCRLYPFTPGNVSPYQVFEYGEPSLLGDNRVLDPPKIRAIADNVLAQHPDGFAFYNFYVFDFGPYYSDLRTWTDPRQTADMAKHYLNLRRLVYHATERETFDLGIAFQRDSLTAVGDRVERPFRFSTERSNVTVTLRCAFTSMRDGDSITVRINGAVVSPDSIWSRTVVRDGDSHDELRVWRSATAAASLLLGDNAIRWELTARAPHRSRAISVGEFELLVTPLPANP